MNINITLDIESAIQSAVSAEKLTPIINKAINEAIVTAINNATNYGSDFRKAVEAQLKEALPHGLNIGEVAKFQQVLNLALTNSVHLANQNAVTIALQKAAEVSVIDVPAKITMSQVLNAYRDSLNLEGRKEFYAHYEISYGFAHLYLSDERHLQRRLSQYEALVRIGFDKDGSVYSLALDGKQITPASRPNVVGYFDDLMLAMYVGRTGIIADLDADQVKDYAAGHMDGDEE